MTKEEKAAAKEQKRLEKIEKKNNRFFRKLKRKIDELFDSKNLTFAGKIFMLSLYCCASSAVGIIVVSVVRSVLNAILKLAEINVKISVLGGAIGLFWTAFIITLIYAIIISIVEIVVNCENGSILEKEE